jgi:hypothetical protein
MDEVTAYRPLVEASDLKWHLSVVVAEDMPSVEELRDRRLVWKRNCPGGRELAAKGQRTPELERIIEELGRRVKRQLAPFSGVPSLDPKRSGRKAGKGHGRQDLPKCPKRVDETIRVGLRSAVPIATGAFGSTGRGSGTCWICRGAAARHRESFAAHLNKVGGCPTGRWRR